MLVTVYSFARAGAVHVLVRVEVDSAPGKPSTIVLGLPEDWARVSIRRVEEALTALGFHLPTGRTVVNVLPIGIATDADGLELPIAVGMLLSTGQAKAPDQLIVGDLSTGRNGAAERKLENRPHHQVVI